MRKLVVLLGFLATTAAYGSSCLPGTLDSYIGLADGCDLLSVHVDSFFLAPTQSFATFIDPALVQVTPGGTASSPSLLFTLNTTAVDFDLFESFFHFSVTGVLGGGSIELISPAATGNGLVLGILDICSDGFFLGVEPIGCSGSADTAIAAYDTFNSQLVDPITFPASSFFDVFVDLTADGGLDGTATLSSSKVSFAAVPEPSSILLLTATLGAIVLKRSRRAH